MGEKKESARKFDLFFLLVFLSFALESVIDLGYILSLNDGNMLAEVSSLLSKVTLLWCTPCY